MMRLFDLELAEQFGDLPHGQRGGRRRFGVEQVLVGDDADQTAVAVEH